MSAIGNARNGGDRPTFFCRFYSMEQIFYLIRVAKSRENWTIGDDEAEGGVINVEGEDLYVRYRLIRFLLKKKGEVHGFSSPQEKALGLF